jgi:hypothetical protein
MGWRLRRCDGIRVYDIDDRVSSKTRAGLSRGYLWLVALERYLFTQTTTKSGCLERDMPDTRAHDRTLGRTAFGLSSPCN